MSRAKRIRKAKMARRQAAYAERLEKHLDEVHELLADLRERSRFRKHLGDVLSEIGVPHSVTVTIGALIDPIGAGTDMIKRHVEQANEKGESP